MTDSGFDLGLDDAARAGVFFVTSDDIATLDMASRDAGLLSRRIDLRGCADKATLMLRLATALDFPAGSGRNWDAASDRLRDLSWLAPADGADPAGVFVVVDHAGALWRGAYRAPAAWLLLAFALASLAALGLSVANQGALYRLRYGYALVCVVLAVGALPGSSAVVGSRERSRGEHPGNH